MLAFSFAALAAVAFVATLLVAAARVVFAFGVALVAAAAAARVPRFVVLTTVVPLETAEASEAEVWFEDWLVVR